MIFNGKHPDTGAFFQFRERGVTFFEQERSALDKKGGGWYIIIVEGKSCSRHYAGDSSIILFHNSSAS